MSNNKYYYEDFSLCYNGKKGARGGGKSKNLTKKDAKKNKTTVYNKKHVRKFESNLNKIASNGR